MKILLTGPDYFDYTDRVAWALGELGHQVECLPFLGFAEKCTYVEKKMEKWGWTKRTQQHLQNWNQRLRAQIVEQSPQLLIVLNGDWIEPESLEVAKKSGSELCLWLIDSIRRMPVIEARLNYFDRIYSFEPSDADYIGEKWGYEIRYLSGGYDPRCYYEEHGVEREIDLSFVGAPTPKRLNVLQAVACYAKKNRLTLVVCGKYWSERYFWKKLRFSQKYPELAACVRNGWINSQQVADLYRRSKICLNIHIEEHDGPNSRIFEILATGSFQLLDDKATLRQVIEPGAEVIVYRDSEELLEKIGYYLGQDKEKCNVLEKGIQRVRREHSIIQKAMVLVGG